ncbi:MAG TPA: ATP-binding protein [Ktedonobacteraceae bacterium]
MTAHISPLYDHQNRNGASPVEGESQELVDVLQKIVHNAGALLEVTSCSVALLDPAGTTLIPLAALQKHGRKPRHTRFRMGEGVAGWVAENREALIINDVSLDPRFKRSGRTPIGSIACVPLIDRDNFIGTLTASSTETNAFSPQKLHMLTIFAEQAVLAISNARRLRTDQEQLRAILTASSDGIAIIGVNGSFLEVNPAFGRIFGMEPQQIVSMECLELLGRDEGSTHETRREICMIQKAIRQHQALSYIEVDLNIQGSSRSLGLSVTPISSANRPFCLMIARDVTAIRDATRMKANFLSMITHELRSPLNAINGYLDLVLTGIAGELNEQQHEFVQRARAGSEHLYALIEDLLLVSRADAGQMRLNRELSNLQEIVANAIEELELTARDNQITINVGIASDFPPIYTDAVRIQHVLRNLISNSLRFTPPGGNVIVSANITHQATSTSSEEHERLVEIQVRDTGYGIAPEHQQQIFERFYQVPLSNHGRTNGQGLGLAIVKMIVELHGGRVTVESAPAQGSTFSFTLAGLLS